MLKMILLILFIGKIHNMASTTMIETVTITRPLKVSNMFKLIK